MTGDWGQPFERLVERAEEVGLGGPDAGENPEHFEIGDLRNGRRIDTRTALFGGTEMERRGVGNELDLQPRVPPVINRNERLIDNVDETEGKYPKIRVTSVAVAQVLARIHRHLHEISEPICRAPCAVLLGRVRNASRLVGKTVCGEEGVDE